MPRYRFSWENLSPTLLGALCDSLGLKGDVPADILRASYGARPKPEFVRATWPMLRDRWLVDDAASRAAILDQLRKARLGSADAPVGTQEEQMAYLRSCHSQQSLREIVLAQFLAVGEASATPTSAQAAVPIGSSISALDHIDDELLKQRVLSPVPLSVDDDALLVAAARRARAGGTKRPSAPDASAVVESDGPRQAAEWPWTTLARPQAGLSDMCGAILDQLEKALLMDAEWRVREARTLTWWSWHLRQVFTVSQPALAFGDPMLAIHYYTDVVSDVADPDKALGAVEILAPDVTMNAYVYEPETRVIRLCGSAYIHEGNLSWQRILAMAALLQNIDAHAKAPQIAQMVGGKPAVSPHPTSGLREKMDDLLNIVPNRVIPDGKRPSPYGGSSLAMMLKEMSQPPWLLGPEGPTGELPFTGSVPTILRGAAASSGSTSKFQVASDGAHPYLGSGALVLLKLGFSDEPKKVLELSLKLNLAEAHEPTGFPLIGSWTIDAQSKSLTHVTFLPTTIFDPGLLRTVAFYSSLRNEWARQRLSAQKTG